MKRYPTFMYGRWVGHCTMDELITFKNQFYNRATQMAKQYSSEYKHIVYAYYDYDDDDNRVYHFDMLPKTEKEFDTISKLSNYFIYAIHRR